MRHIKPFKGFSIGQNLKAKYFIKESLKEGEDDVYVITDDNEIGGESMSSSYCKDFKVTELKVGDEIQHVLVSADDNEYNWCKDIENIEYYDRMAEIASRSTLYKVLQIDLPNKLIKLE